MASVSVCSLRQNLAATKKYSSSIDMLTRNIISELPGNYKQQLKYSLTQISSDNLSKYDKKILKKCGRELQEIGEKELCDLLRSKII